MKYLLLALVWIAWCTLHSGMISLTVTGIAKRRLGTHYRVWRLLFNLVAVATLVPVVLYERSLDGTPLFCWDGPFWILRMILLVIAGGLFLAGIRHYDMLQCAGIRQIRTGNSHAVLAETGRIDTSGVLGLTRHPWYLAAIIVVWTRRPALTSAGLIAGMILTVYLLIGTILEERKLLAEVGQEYRDYRKRVSMLLPLKWLKAICGYSI